MQRECQAANQADQAARFRDGCGRERIGSEHNAHAGASGGPCRTLAQLGTCSLPHVLPAAMPGGETAVAQRELW